MRMTVKWNLFHSLNVFQAVFESDIHWDPISSSVIEFETVKFPTNLELVAKEGKNLYIIGQCSDGKRLV
jgi:hypothetical protein